MEEDRHIGGGDKSFSSPYTNDGNNSSKSPGDSAIEAFSLFKTYLDAQLKDFKQTLVSRNTEKEKPAVQFKRVEQNSVRI